MDSSVGRGSPSDQCELPALSERRCTSADASSRTRSSLTTVVTASLPALEGAPGEAGRVSLPVSLREVPRASLRASCLPCSSPTTKVLGAAIRKPRPFGTENVYCSPTYKAPWLTNHASHSTSMPERLVRPSSTMHPSPVWLTVNGTPTGSGRSSAEHSSRRTSPTARSMARTTSCESPP